MENLNQNEKDEVRSLQGEVYALTRKIGELEVIKAAHLEKLNEVKHNFKTLVNKLVDKYGEDLKLDI